MILCWQLSRFFSSYHLPGATSGAGHKAHEPQCLGRFALPPDLAVDHIVASSCLSVRLVRRARVLGKVEGKWEKS